MGSGLSGNPQYASNPFFFALLPYIEQDNVFKAVSQSGASWGNGGGVNGQTVVIKPYLCPSDSSHNNGIGPNTGWSVSSYSRNFFVFDSGAQENTGNGHYRTPAKYQVGNIPDGTSNTIAIVERYAYYPSYGWSGLWSHHAQEKVHWGYSQWSTVYGPWPAGNNPANWSSAQSYTPQVGKAAKDAHPYYPNGGHSGTVQVLLMDGSVRGVSGSVSPATWSYAVSPDDGQSLGSNW